MNEQGAAGEEAAAEFLRGKGYEIILQNYGRKSGELDIVAVKNGRLSFVEVKERGYDAYGGPLLAVTKAKQNKIVSAAALYVKEKRPKFDTITFDVITVLDGKIEHIENAFTPRRMTL
ncbi:MAG: YraN family protein [Elusimicrobium sp.]|jgi:putative endonuclease|nr:YraN family protein [Elusimicrobium sp.]